LSKQGAGVDHWFWKKLREESRSQKIYPPEIKQFLFDERQWYPPIFGLLLRALPNKVFNYLERFLSILFDLLRFGLVICFVYYYTGKDIFATTMAGVFYATSPILIFYNTQLNPRGLGALLLDGWLLVLGCGLTSGFLFWHWVLGGLLGALVLLTHKMTTQLLFFLALCSAAILGKWQPVALLALGISAALIFSGGFYINVLRAHAEIVAFWSRNWRWIGADPLRESPIYGDPGYQRPGKLHAKGLFGQLRKFVILVAMNPASWVCLVLLVERAVYKLTGQALFNFPTFIALWLAFIILLSLLTTYFDKWKCLGAGYLYLYNSVSLASVLLAMILCFSANRGASYVILTLACLGNLTAVGTYYLEFWKSARLKPPLDLHALVSVLAQKPEGAVICWPTVWADFVTYKTPHPVLWGCHGLGFKKIEEFWPVLKIRWDEVVRKYHPRYLVIENNAVPQKLFREFEVQEDEKFGSCRLVTLK